MRIFQSAPDGIVISDFGRKGVFDLNQRFEQISGYNRSEILGRTLTDIGLLMEPLFWHRLLANLRADGFLENLEYQMRRKTGEIATVLWSAELITIDNRPCFVSVHRDITAEKSTAASLGSMRHDSAQEHEAIGRLVGQIADDFNGFLTSLLGSADLARAHLDADSTARRNPDDMSEAALRTQALTRQLVTFSRATTAPATVLDLNVVIERLARILRLVVGDRIELVMRTRRAVAPIRADADRIEQLLMNLVVNARDAMSAGGVLTIATDVVDVDHASARRHPDAVPGAFVRLRVTDTGSGLSSEDQARIFTPWFTTKGPEGGHGLGLAIVRAIARQAGGFVQVTSALGKGATFAVYFPRLTGSERQRGA